MNRNHKHEPPGQNEKPNEGINSKFKTLNSLSELPLEQKQLWDQHHTKIIDILVNDLAKGSDYDSRQDSVIEYIAFQQMQIHGIQKEIQNSLNLMLEMGKEIDRQFEKVKTMIPNNWN